jgi:hypothetical protein
MSNDLEKIDEAVCNSLASVCKDALTASYKNLPALGKCFIDERLRDYFVPFSQRSASKALRTVVRGSQVAVPEGNTLRFFLWWHEGIVNGIPTGRVDIDLSAAIYNSDWKYMEHLSYTNLRSDKYRAAHSGDITSAPEGACEFIDIDIESVLQYGGRYIIVTLYSFSSQPFCNLPECSMGWMMREFPLSGEIFEPKTVQDKIDVASDAQICIPFFFDLKERKLIWADLVQPAQNGRLNNLESSIDTFTLLCRAVANLRKPNLYDLFEIHVAARGTISTAEEAETVFSLAKGITPFDTDVIMGEYL